MREPPDSAIEMQILHGGGADTEEKREEVESQFAVMRTRGNMRMARRIHLAGIVGQDSVIHILPASKKSITVLLLSNRNQILMTTIVVNRQYESIGRVLDQLEYRV